MEYSFKPGSYPKLIEDMRKVGLYGTGTDGQRFRDLVIA